MNKLDGLFSEPKHVARPLRILVFAQSKRGKSHFVHSSTEIGPLYWIDTERGSDFYDPEGGHGFLVRYDKDPHAAIKAIEAANGKEPRPIVAIDSFSSVWFEQQEVAERISRGGRQAQDGDRATFRSWAVAKKPLKRLYELLHSTTCHVIITAREKDEYEVSSSGEPKKIGVKPDVERNLEYAMDFVVHMGVDDLPMGKAPQPKNFWARVVGTRSTAIPIGTVLKNPKFSDFLPAVMEGEDPAEIGGSAAAQAERELQAPQSWPDFLRRAKELNSEWSADQLRAMLKEKFGAFDNLLWAEYWEYIQGMAKDET